MYRCMQCYCLSGSQTSLHTTLHGAYKTGGPFNIKVVTKTGFIIIFIVNYLYIIVIILAYCQCRGGKGGSKPPGGNDQSSMEMVSNVYALGSGSGPGPTED